MSGLELVAGIAGVAAAAIKVSVSMNDLAEELGSAGRDVRYIGNDMAGFSQVLRLIQSSLEESIKTAGSTVIQSVFDTLPQLVEQCTLVYDEADGLMLAIKGSNGKESFNVFQRFKFVFYKGRITILRSLLDSSKSTLNLLLVTLNIEMAKNRSPDKALMDQLQNERKAFIRVVYSQNKALDEAMKEVEKAKKEAAKFRNKREKEKEKEKEREKQERGGDLDACHDDITIEVPKRNSTPYSYKPPPPYTLHSAPSVSQLVYQPPSIERFNSVRNSSKAVTTLALSLEPTRPTNTYGMPTPPTSPPDSGPYEYQSPFAPQSHQSPDAPPSGHETAPGNTGDLRTSAHPAYPGKRVFSDPGPATSSDTSHEHLSPGNPPQERSRSPYGFSRVPQDELPKVHRKRPTFPFSAPDTNSSSSAHGTHRTFSTPASGNYNMGSVPEVPEPTPASPRSATTAPTTEQRKPSFTYHPPPPPPPPTYPDLFDQFFNNTPPDQPKPTSPLPKTTIPPPPPPPPRHGTTYIVLEPYLSQEIGHLSLVPFDTLVDVIAHVPETTGLPYPTAFDGAPTHFWQASLGNRRGPRGLFPVSTVCSIDDERVTETLKESWFAEKEVGFIADSQGRCWIGPGW
ncbi:hypothetical protein DE146DRAFT_660391 [Phaeosphaeria sp. MPI-PUGE-AT-0046c]|nr:hypothetical protein DE146DRAFT_660391 [Phaeosphaeria sp. MPI-PUGE-AT-0046c]